MKPLTPQSHDDTLDEQIAAALHGDLTPEERAAFDARLQAEPAARAAYHEAQAMHDLLEKTHATAQPEPDFEQRMVSAVRRKLKTEDHRETAWESLTFFYRFVRRRLAARWTGWEYGAVAACLVVMLTASHVMWHDLGVLRALGNNGISNPSVPRFYLPQSLYARALELDARAANTRRDLALKTEIDALKNQQLAPNGYRGGTMGTAGNIELSAGATTAHATSDSSVTAAQPAMAPPPPLQEIVTATAAPPPPTQMAQNNSFDINAVKLARSEVQREEKPNEQWQKEKTETAAGESSAHADSRKLIRNAQLDLEVKSYQAAFDSITALTKQAGGYVDTSHSQRGGNGKLQGTVVVKVLPQNLDAFLLKLRDLGELTNQSVSTDDVTKDYFDTQARLENGRRMETQLQELLKRENGKVSDLLAVERELARVRGEIEQMQGQLKLYDFQVQYATVTMNLREKDLNQAAAYLLREQDDFALFATNVEATFQQARHTADDFKAQVLQANLNHNSGSDVSAEFVVMVAPDQIESFLAQVRGLGRVANFTRQTQRVAKDGGDASQPADATLTEKDKVQVHLAIRSDDESRKQVALTVVAKAVDGALEQAKTAALASAGVEILGSSLNKTPQGQSTAQLSVRVPGRDYAAVISSFKALGRTSSLSIQRTDNSGPGANGDDAPVIVSLSLTDDDTPLQQTQMTVLAADVDAQAQRIKKSAAEAGVEVKASSFERAPDGTEVAQMTFRLPMGKYPAFLENVKALGEGRVAHGASRRPARPGGER